MAPVRLDIAIWEDRFRSVQDERRHPPDEVTYPPQNDNPLTTSDRRVPRHDVLFGRVLSRARDITPPAAVTPPARAARGAEVGSKEESSSEASENGKSNSTLVGAVWHSKKMASVLSSRVSGLLAG